MRRRDRHTYSMASRYAGVAIAVTAGGVLALHGLQFGIRGALALGPAMGAIAAYIASITDEWKTRVPSFPLTEDEYEGVAELLNPLWILAYISIAVDPTIAVTALFAVAGVHLEAFWTLKRNRRAARVDDHPPALVTDRG